MRSGSSAALTQQCFCPQIFETTHDTVLEALGGSDPAQVARAAATGLFGQIGLLARRVNERLTGRASRCQFRRSLPAIARRRPQLELAFIEREFWTDIDRSATLCTYFNGRLESLFPVRSGTFTLWLRTLIICRLALVAHGDALLRDHRAAGQMAIGDSPGTEPAYLAEVDRLLQQSRERVFRCMVRRPLCDGADPAARNHDHCQDSRAGPSDLACSR